MFKLFKNGPSYTSIQLGCFPLSLVFTLHLSFDQLLLLSIIHKDDNIRHVNGTPQFHTPAKTAGCSTSRNGQSA